MKPIKELKKDKLGVKIFETRAQMGLFAAREAAEAVKSLLLEKDEVNIIFAAAPSQNEFLAALIDSGIDFSRINAFHMDEYIGLPSNAPQGFGNFLKSAIFDKAGFKTVNLINTEAVSAAEECERYSSLLAEHPCDIVCMGIGENGHIAFNDPHVAFFNDDKAVKAVTLDEKCRMQQVNDGCFKELGEVPKEAITLTIPTLMSPQYVFCMVPALSKAEAVKNTVHGEITEKCPASILRTHDKAVLYIDRDSASLL